MELRDITNLRLINQQLASGKLNSAKELVGWMGAMQAQDYNQAKWAIGVRLPHLTEEHIESAFNKGEIFRTHLMRPTWHFVSADNIYWMLELTAPQIIHAPATLPDFVWWSGLSVSDARRGLEMNMPGLNSATTGPEIYWFESYTSSNKTLPDSVYLLPAFDEFLISYKNRSAVIAAEDHKKAISENGIFRPVVLVNGQISGLWKRTFKKDTTVIQTEYFRAHNKTEERLMAHAADLFGHFSGKKAEIKFTEMPP